MLTRRPRDDDGSSLAELMVCMALTTVIGAIALSFFLWTGSSTRATAASSYSLQTSRAALTTVTGALRLAVPGTVTPTAAAIAWGTRKLSASVTFSAADSVVAGCPTRPTALITLIVTGGGVRMDRSGPVNAPIAGQPCRFVTNSPTSKVLVTGVRVPTGFLGTDDTTAATPTIAPADVAAVTFVLGVTGPGGNPQTYQATAVISGDAA